MFVYPLLPVLLHLDPHAYGLWAGASIHEVAQVVAAAFQNGQTAGDFGTIAAVGWGGTGKVYRADDLTLGQSVALKFLPAELARDPGLLARLHAEVRTARQVSQMVTRN